METALAIPSGANPAPDRSVSRLRQAAFEVEQASGSNVDAANRASGARRADTAPCRVLVVHNGYLQSGGEDGVVDAEVALLRAHGHAVFECRRHNDGLASANRLKVAVNSVWSTASHAETRALIERHRPDVVHVHNTLARISPSVIWACASAKVPVVQTLHNFRLACPQAMLLRNGKVCEDCVGRLPWPALIHRCYQGSRTRTAVMVAMLGTHRALGTWQTKVSRFVALTGFCRAKFIEAGLPAQRLVVKPNFVESPPFAEGVRGGFLYVGRLAPEKGIEVLGRAWGPARHAFGHHKLRVAGTGPEQAALAGLEGITLLGALPGGQVTAEMRQALALVLPSLWYENFPLVLVEAFAAGLPVIASRIGALAELIDDGRTGLLFDPGDAAALTARLQWAHDHPAAMRQMGMNARARYEALYSPDINYRQTLAIYRSAIDEVAAAA